MGPAPQVSWQQQAWLFISHDEVEQRTQGAGAISRSQGCREKIDHLFCRRGRSNPQHPVETRA